MNKTNMNLIFAAAVLTVASSAASAQTLKAAIPFNFTVAGRPMAAGTYELSAGDHQKRFTVRNLQSYNTVIVLSEGGRDPEKSWKSLSSDGIVQFVCGDGCALERIWTNSGYPAQKFAAPKSESGKPARLSLIRLSADQVKGR